MKPFSIKKKDSTAAKSNAFTNITNQNNLGSKIDEEEDDLPQSTQSLVAFVNEKSPASNEPGSEPKEFVIKPVPNRDWKSETWKRHGLEESAQVTDTSQQRFGHHVVRDDRTDSTGRRTDSTGRKTDTVGIVEASKENKYYIKPPTEEELARFALLNQRTLEEERIIEMDSLEPRISETQAYRQDITTRPDEPDMDAYNRMPVEEFGAALLRGMGWNGVDNDTQGKNEDPNIIKQRPPLLGLGAKSLDSAIEESGAWGKGAYKQPTKAEKSYIPLIKVNKKTGQVMKDDDNYNPDDNIFNKGEHQASDKERERGTKEIQEDYRNGHREIYRGKDHADYRERYELDYPERYNGRNQKRHSGNGNERYKHDYGESSNDNQKRHRDDRNERYKHEFEEESNGNQKKHRSDYNERHKRNSREKYIDSNQERHRGGYREKRREIHQEMRKDRKESYLPYKVDENDRDKYKNRDYNRKDRDFYA